MTYLDYLLVREMRLLKNVGWSFIVQFTAPVFEVFLQHLPILASAPKVLREWPTENSSDNFFFLVFWLFF